MPRTNIHIEDFLICKCFKTKGFHFAVPASRAGKILRFKHYTTDAPI